MHRYSVVLILCLTVVAVPSRSESSTPEQFSPFLRRFVSDSAFRESRIVLPLEAHVGSRCEEDVKSETWDQKTLERRFTLPLSGRELRDRGLSRLFEYSEGEVKMHQFREEADSYLVLYVFQLRADRWFLVQFFDESC